MIDLRPTRPWEDESCILFRDAVRRFFAREVRQADERWRRQKHVDRAFWESAGAQDMLCPSIPEEYGGGGGDFRFDAIVSEELSYADSTSFIGQGVHGPVVAHYLLAYGDEDQRRRWLPDMCAGRKIAAVAMTEPGGGSDLKAIQTTARREGDVYRLHGSKTFITNGHNADLVLVAAKTDPSAGAKGLSLLMVDVGEAQGFRRGRNLDKIGVKGSDTAELFFDDVAVPASARVGAEGAAFGMMMSNLAQERLIIAIVAQSMMERAIELTLDYTGARHAFQQPLLNFQNTRFKLADAYTQVKVSRAFVDQCIEQHCRAELSGAEASMAKLHTTELLGTVADTCLQLHGGYGYMEEYPISRLWVDGRVQRIYGGSSETMRDIIARQF